MKEYGITFISRETELFEMVKAENVLSAINIFYKEFGYFEIIKVEV